MEKFWKWKQHRIRNEDTGEDVTVRELDLYGTIAEESWFDDDITPAMFRDELFAGGGPVIVWINSPGGDLERMLNWREVTAHEAVSLCLSGMRMG